LGRIYLAFDFRSLADSPGVESMGRDVLQAGQSGPGQSFAAKWADLVFVIFHILRARIREYAAFEATARDVDALVLLSEVLNYDFGVRPRARM
jgi:alkanesulfonate monooxygenase SsuD/methylene tetrahydromethanopterin reductase-like flavin-dependent oxidoreductase (luciferase family)